MARPHHRKKHKTHVRQFRQSHDTKVSSPRNSAKAISVFTIAGALAGFAIGYFATQGSLLWLVAGTLAGGALGYFIGKRIDGEEAD